MKVIGIILLSMIICFTSLPVFSGELDMPYCPSRKEWLRISIFYLIKDHTDSWKQRIGSMIWVRENEKTIFITLTSANGQKEISREAQNEYCNVIKRVVESLIEEYDWARSLKVHVQFM
ncbi:MAG: hypothetical protein ACYDHW_06915 [Syntrophorhabdaceae bacterium]